MKLIHLLLVLLLPLLGCAPKTVSLHAQSAHSYGNRAFNSFISGDFIAALTNYGKAFTYAGYSDDPVLQAQYLFNIGRIYFEMDQYDSANRYFSASLQEYIFYHDSSGEAAVTAWKAMSYSFSGKHDSAEILCTTAGFNRNRSNLPFWYTVRARMESAKRNYLHASLLLDSALNILRKKEDFDLLSMNCFYRGSIAAVEKRFDKALMLLDSAIELSNESGAKYRRWKILLKLVEVNISLHNENAAHRFYYRAMECAPSGVTLPGIREINNRF